MRVLIFFIILFFVELGGFVAFSEEFGFLALIAEIILSGILGVFLLFNSFSGSNESIIDFLRGAKDPKEIIASNLAKVFGAILLIIPGIFGDCLGLLLQIGILDSLLASFLGKATIKTSFSQTYAPTQEVIDAEIIEEKKEIEHEEAHYRK